MTIFSIFDSDLHFKTIRNLCRKILGCNIKSTDLSTIEYFQGIKNYLNNENLRYSEKFLIAAEALLRTYSSGTISSVYLEYDEKRLGQWIENIIANICAQSNDHYIKSFIYRYIEDLFPGVKIHGICPTFGGPCNDISFLLELNNEKFIFPIEVKSTNRHNMSFLGNRCLTGPCSIVLVVGYDYIIKYRNVIDDNNIKIQCLAIIPLEKANTCMKKTKQKKRIESSNSTKFIHDFIDRNFEKYLRDNNLWYGGRPTFFTKKYSYETGSRYKEPNYQKHGGSSSKNWRKNCIPRKIQNV